MADAKSSQAVSFNCNKLVSGATVPGTYLKFAEALVLRSSALHHKEA